MVTILGHGPTIPPYHHTTIPPLLVWTRSYALNAPNQKDLPKTHKQTNWEVCVYNFEIKKFLKEHMTYFMKLREILIIIIIIDVIDHRADIAMQK